jgi:hypothetical protein
MVELEQLRICLIFSRSSRSPVLLQIHTMWSLGDDQLECHLAYCSLTRLLQLYLICNVLFVDS